MKGYIQAPQNNQYQLQTFSAFQFINLILVIIDSVAVFKFLIDDLDMIIYILPTHAIILLPSILYQVSPEIRDNITYKTISNLISFIMVGFGVINFFLLSCEDDPITLLLYYLIFISVSLPGAIISASLLLLLKFEILQPEPRLMMVPQDCESIHTPMV